jgi:hypothetical protein
MIDNLRKTKGVTTMQNELKPCPYCGGTPKLYQKGYKFYYECDGDCWTQTHKHYDIGDAVIEWNNLERKEENNRDTYIQEVKHGYWEKYDENIFSCSECGYDWYLTNLASHPIENDAFYCPCCGVEMDGVDNAE